MGGSRIRATVLVGAAVGWAALAGGVLAADKAVTIAQFAFSPDPITIKAGDTVTWTNNDGVSHTATGTGWDAGTVSPGGSRSVTFATAGTFTYVCQFHGNMRGTVVVQAATGGSGSGSGSTPTTPPTDTAVAPDAQPVPTGGAGVLLLGIAGVAGLAAGWRRLAGARARTR